MIMAAYILNVCLNYYKNYQLIVRNSVEELILWLLVRDFRSFTVWWMMLSFINELLSFLPYLQFTPVFLRVITVALWATKYVDSNETWPSWVDFSQKRMPEPAQPPSISSNLQHIWYWWLTMNKKDMYMTIFDRNKFLKSRDFPLFNLIRKLLSILWSGGYYGDLGLCDESACFREELVAAVLDPTFSSVCNDWDVAFL